MMNPIQGGRGKPYGKSDAKRQCETTAVECEPTASGHSPRVRTL
jgi:hypothetical protein